MKNSAAALLAAGVVAAGGVLAVTASADGAATHQAAPTVNPGKFNNPRPNPYFPLEPGTVTRLRGTDDGEHFREVVKVTDRTKTVQGVETTVVRDVVRRADGRLAEKTHDWYAADNDGRVWYFGERTATYDQHGNVESREGSWEAGLDGARAGTIMPPNPHSAQAYRQEYWKGHAEDQAWIVKRGGATTVPYGRVRHVLRSLRVEPSRARRDVAEALRPGSRHRPREGHRRRQRGASHWSRSTDPDGLRSAPEQSLDHLPGPPGHPEVVVDQLVGLPRRVAADVRHRGLLARVAGQRVRRAARAPG